jgi:DNA mismatch endonuclease, patch repair protein
MSAIRSRENRVERELRRSLHRAGLRFRKYVRGLPGKPDIVFMKARVAVFVDGDFWHARVLKENDTAALYATLRTKNKSYWLAKFTRRVQRDAEVDQQLVADGWTVIRMWESDVDRDIETAASRIAAEVRSRGLRGTSARTASP